MVYGVLFVVCCAPQKLVEIFIFSKKSWKNEKKQEICSKIHQKTCFLSLHQNAGLGFYSQKKPSFFHVFRGKNIISDTKSYEKLEKTSFPMILVVFQSLQMSERKTIAKMCKLKKHVFC